MSRSPSTCSIYLAYLPTYRLLLLFLLLLLLLQKQPGRCLPLPCKKCLRRKRKEKKRKRTHEEGLSKVSTLIHSTNASSPGPCTALPTYPALDHECVVPAVDAAQSIRLFPTATCEQRWAGSDPPVEENFPFRNTRRAFSRPVCLDRDHKSLCCKGNNRNHEVSFCLLLWGDG